MPRPLPTILPVHLEGSNVINDAYSTILNIEQGFSAMISEKSTLPNTASIIKGLETKLMHVRILGHLITAGPSTEASEFVANNVNLCRNNQDRIDKLGEFYFIYFIRLCMSPSLALLYLF